MTRLIGLRVLAGTEPGNLVCEFRLDEIGMAVLIRRTDTWACTNLVKNGAPTGSLASIFAPTIAEHYGVPIELHRWYRPEDGAPFLIACISDMQISGRLWYTPITEHQPDEEDGEAGDADR